MGMQLVQSMRLKQYFTTRMSMQARLLPMNSDTLETELDKQLKDNPALLRTGGLNNRVQSWSKDRVSAATDDRLPADQRHSVPDGFEEGLIAEFRLARLPDEVLQAGAAIILNLEGRGFLAESHDKIAELAGVSVEAVKRAQDAVMNLEPEGVGANDLVHYLTFMVDKLYGEDPFFHEIINNQLDDLRKQRFDIIATAIDQDEEDVEEYQNMLHAVRPYPTYGLGGGEDAVAIHAQMSLEKGEEGWLISMHEEPTHHLKLNEDYITKIREMPKGKERIDAQKQLQDARELLQVLEERHSLLKQVAQLAVEHQRAWFDHNDPQYKRNLTQVAIAEELEKHPSVISRVVQGKYVEWNGRTIRLRDLFHFRRCASGDDTSEARLHARIQAIIDGEDGRRPLSDDAISRMLKEEGIRCARRTVAKHRDRLDIPSSTERRRRAQRANNR